MRKISYKLDIDTSAILVFIISILPADTKQLYECETTETQIYTHLFSYGNYARPAKLGE